MDEPILLSQLLTSEEIKQLEDLRDSLDLNFINNNKKDEKPTT